MLTRVADGVQVHTSEFVQTNTVVVQGSAGVLLVDPGVQGHEVACLAGDLSDRPVVAGFSTHPDWDHLLWHERLGTAPRYGTARAAATIRDMLTEPGFRQRLTEHIPPDAVDVPLDLLGLISGLDGDRIPWDGPVVRIVEHRAHAPGHAALVTGDVLVAGDMVSDVLVPMLDHDAADPIGDYLAALDLLESLAGGVRTVIPGHGTAGADLPARIALDRAYVQALKDNREPDDPRIGAAQPGWEWVRDVHEGQRARLATR